MVRIVDTSTLSPESRLTREENLWIYNGLDGCLTQEVHDSLLETVDEHSTLIYNFTRAMLAPALEMTLRGIRIHPVERAKTVAKLRAELDHLRAWIDELAEAMWGKPLNPASPRQLNAFFYDYLNLPAITKRNTAGKYTRTTNRDALERLQVYLYARPIILAILASRDAKKKLDVLQFGVSADGRYHSSYNVVGTETGRWSSSKTPDDEGGNAQNITDSMRRAFVADEGKKMGYFDLEQAESRLAGLLAFIATGKHTYLDACESGDLHTTVCRMVWPDLAWTGDLTHDKKVVAGEIFYRTYTYRDMSKRGGHGSNYFGKPPTMASHLKVAVDVMRRFQERYFTAFPELPEWHQWVITQLQTLHYLISPLGRRRWFFNRSWDEATWREAIASVPQGCIGDVLNLALWRLWRAAPELGIELLGQVHDAILFQYPEEREEEIVSAVVALMQVEIPGPGRTVTIPVEPTVGWNWSHYNDDPAKGPVNLDGLKAWKGKDDRKRQQQL